MITKAQAVQLTNDYHTWEEKGRELIDQIDNDIRYRASHGMGQTTLTKSDDLTEESFNMALQAVGEAGFDVQLAYSKIENPTGNPKQQKWYELVNNKYVLTEDTTVTEGKTYYKRVNKSVVIKWSDSSWGN